MNNVVLLFTLRVKTLLLSLFVFDDSDHTDRDVIATDMDCESGPESSTDYCRSPDDRSFGRTVREDHWSPDEWPHQWFN